MGSWIESSPYRTDISWLTLLLAGLAVFIVGIITVSYQAIKAARTNPIESLRCE